MENRNIKKYLYDIKQSIDSINEYLGENRNFFEYQENKQLRRAVERELEIIGEAVNKALVIQPNLSDSKRNKMVAKISEESIQQVLSNPNLNEDQKAIIEIVSNTINSSDKHVIEYAGIGNISYDAQLAFVSNMSKSPELSSLIRSVVEKNGGIPVNVLSALGGGEGVTAKTYNGSYSVIFTGKHQNGRPVTMGHEVFGHGRPLALGRTDESQQHIDAVQMENLILRVMHINYINNGANHGPGIMIKNPSDIPSYR